VFCEPRELSDTWIVGAPIAGQNVDTTLTVAVIDDLNHDGIYNDAPSTTSTSSPAKPILGEPRGRHDVRPLASSADSGRSQRCLSPFM
jgi:hypothetical protein